MNCLLIGLGSHAKKIYLEFLEKEAFINKVIIVDLVTEHDSLESILSKININYDLLLFDNLVRHTKSLPPEYEKLLEEKVRENDIKKVIISTEPRSYKLYIDFCLKHGLDIMCGKPITTPLYAEAGSDGEIKGNQIGGLTHFEILVLGIDDSKYDLVQNEVAMFDRLRDFFLDKHAYSNIRRHKTSVSLVSELQYNIPPHPKNENFRFAVELLIKHNGKYLLCKRSSDAKIAPGIWNIPAGKVKYNEGIEEALIRECEEETNLKVSNVCYLDCNFINKEHKRIVYLYVTEVADISDLRIDAGEFDEWEWIKAEDVDNYESVNLYIKRWLSELG
ncbi:hypothetical protein RU86_GL000171 [Lactococcus piscium]|uniref:Nudix hydrolase domain-containing protein n=1 Tax=Pseudolactococcus piscium TaxID=1364 RepID=A0A2A5S638_9LACT|nr:NUDIX domain-containing protein [Lactococcus piscium]PCS08935.1 hypothetical protein RU86_GL000171 [Lactococcus piscium]